MREEPKQNGRSEALSTAVALTSKAVRGGHCHCEYRSDQGWGNKGEESVAKSEEVKTKCSILPAGLSMLT